MPSKALKDFLDSHEVTYEVTSHSPSFTSQEIAAAAHVSGKQFAKTVIVKIDGKLAMVVLPAHDHVNFAKLQEITGGKEVDLATESDFKDKFAECEVGAMSPFGNLYNMPVYVSKDLCGEEQISFNAGSHSEVLKMKYKDYAELVDPEIVNMH